MVLAILLQLIIIIMVIIMRIAVGVGQVQGPDARSKKTRKQDTNPSPCRAPAALTVISGRCTVSGGDQMF